MDWIRGEALGHGSFAKVNLAVLKNQCPVLPPLMAVKSSGVSHSSSLKSEKLILEELHDCPEVISCFGESFSFENGEKLYNVLLEYASGGSLADKIKASDDQKLPEFEARSYTKQLLKGLDYIHKFGFVHCDIKPQNILLTGDGGVKIADFGLATRAGSKDGSELRGTPMYISPEIVRGGELGIPADIWALGCVLTEMVTGSSPWSCSEVAPLLMKIGVGEEVPEIPGTLSSSGKDFLTKCFVKDPKDRWTAEMLLNHPFVRDEGFSATKEITRYTPVSPRCPFDFPDSMTSTSTSCSITSMPSAAQSWSEESSWPSRLLGLVNDGPDWSVSEDWVTVR